MRSARPPRRPARRNFVKSCVGIMALSLQRRALSNELKAMHAYPPALLVDEHGRPIRVEALRAGSAYVFHFPYLATPCFLINLGEAVAAGGELKTNSGRTYQWPGGVGPDKSVVAFSAICAHKMTHPAKSVSFINYRAESVSYTDSRDRRAKGDHLIYCCSERSVYDARAGARVLGGPADQPLAAIGLEYDPGEDSLVATSTYGGEMFEQFFEKFTSRLQLEHRITDVTAEVGDRTRVQPMEEFTESRVLC